MDNCVFACLDLSSKQDLKERKNETTKSLWTKRRPFYECTIIRKGKNPN